MVWGVCRLVLLPQYCDSILQWAGACILVFCVCLSIAELASAAPTAGGVSGVDLYFDFLLGLLLDPPLRFASLAKPAFLDSWL